MTTSTRHKWGDPVNFPHKTERQCIRCPVVRVSRHETDGPKDVHWIEWWRDGERIETEVTPKCDGSLEKNMDQGAAGVAAPQNGHPGAEGEEA